MSTVCNENEYLSNTFKWIQHLITYIPMWARLSISPDQKYRNKQLSIIMILFTVIIIITSTLGRVYAYTEIEELRNDLTMTTITYLSLYYLATLISIASRVCNMYYFWVIIFVLFL